MRNAIAAICAGLGLASGQDVNMVSNTSAGELVHIENTGNDYKALVSATSGSNNGGLGISVGYYGSASGWSGINNSVSLGSYGSAYGYEGSIGIGDDGWSQGLNHTTYAGSGGYNYGVKSGINAGDNANSYGLYSTVYGGTYGYHYGLYVDTWADAYAYTYGVYSSAGNGGVADAYAGWFNGDVAVTGSCNPCSPSDVMFKKNVRDYRGGLGKILALKPRAYEMRTDEFKDRMNLGKGTKVGFIAQEVEQVMPELVHTLSAPPKLSIEEQKQKVKKEPTKFRAMNYNELVPVLVQAMQEQQAQIEAMKTELAALKARK
ncbi:MAG: type sorting protein [Fibrobacteria bacterium]|nr:type sorting protein [Fibrobacteria bacterium]